MWSQKTKQTQKKSQPLIEEFYFSYFMLINLMFVFTACAQVALSFISDRFNSV